MQATFILLLVVFQLKGPVLTETLSAPRLEDCRAAEPLIKATIVRAHPRAVVTSICLEVDP